MRRARGTGLLLCMGLFQLKDLDDRTGGRELISSHTSKTTTGVQMNCAKLADKAQAYCYYSNWILL